VITAARVIRLPQVVADAIAAGEVVERPASVVKELVENALDAGARRVDVVIHGGGLVDIQVSDDGAGIASIDLPLAVARHATSKIASADDLARVRTHGFRGEALASIAAVSDMTLVSRDLSSAGGTRLRVRFGAHDQPATEAAPVGTRVHVAELFATTPARLRFLRSAGAESAAVVRLLSELALLNHDIAFSCRCDERQTLRTPGGSLHDALRAIHGARATDFIDVRSAGPITVTGAISAPHAHRGQRGGLVLGVNRRRVHHRGLQVAVEEAYRGLIPGNRYPHGVVLIDIDPAEVDVNVHPTKREVRFRDERRVFGAVQRTCWGALQASPLTSGAGLLATAGPESAAPSAPFQEANPPSWRADAMPYAVHRPGEVALADSAPPPEAVAPARTLAGLRPLHALGQVGGEWIIGEAPGAVVLVDPHAAHEKIIYEKLLRRWSESGAPDVQLLLIPAIVTVDALGMERAERHRGLVASWGFDIEPFGPDSVRCSAIPAAAAAADAERLITSLLDALGDDELADVRQSRVAALVACHSAVRFGDELGVAEQQRLLDRLVETPAGTTCPHGRPAVLIVDDAQLRRAFGRPRS
jgi:DNA mismatch repair protein MutL